MKMKEILPFIGGKDDTGENGNGATEASLFNLLVYTHSPKKIDYYREIVNTIIGKFPCKVIFIQGNTEKKEDDFHVEKKLIQTGHIACEHIEIKAGGTHLIQVPYYILPHLAPDLPIYLLWGQDPTEENEVLPRLIKYADRLIFDADSDGDLPQFSERFLKMREKFPCEVLDMNWARIAGWRDVLASAIDTKEKLDTIQNAKSIQIGFNQSKSASCQNTEAQAEYLQSWLASRLGWRLKSTSPKKKFYGGVTVELFPEESENHPPGSILTFILEGHNGEELKIHRSKGTVKQATVSYSTKEECHLPFTIPFQTHSRGLTFVREFLFVAPSDHYIEMLETITKEN